MIQQLALDLTPQRTYTKRDKPLKVLELFGGIGAPRKALENLDINVKSIDYVEILSNAVKAYNAMYDNDYTPQDIKQWNINVDLLVHGSPCVDFSSAGRNDTTTGRSLLYQRTLEIIEKELHPRPRYVLWENVEGLISNKHFHHFDHYLKSLEKLGYKNYWKVLNALDFGLPQHRPRVFVVSIRIDMDQTFDFDALQTKPMKNIIDYLEDIDDGKYDVKQPSMIKALGTKKVKIISDYTATITTKQVRWNSAGVLFKDKRFYERDFKTYPKPKSRHGYSLEEAKEYFPEMFKGKKMTEIFRYLTPRECWNLQGFKEKSEFRESKNCFIYPRGTDGQIINGSHNRAWKIDKFTGTLTATQSVQIGFVKDGKLYHRYLTPEETWLLQGFDIEVFDRVASTGIPTRDLYMLAGNSIPVPVLEAIFKELLLKKE